MTTIYDVPADSLINEAAKELNLKIRIGGICDVHPSLEEYI